MAIQLPHYFANCPSTQAFAWAGGTVAGSLILGLSFAQPVSAAAGLSFSSSGVISEHLDIQQQRVIANVWTSFLVPIEAGSRFISDATPPAPGRRVIIRNVTPGLNNEPFSDRPYENSLGSDVILIKPGQGHETQTFTVIPGTVAAPLQNNFRYEIRENGGTVLESGDFSLSIGISDRPLSTIYRQRHAISGDYRFAPNYYAEYAGYGYGGYYGKRRSLFPRSHFRRQRRQFRHHRR